MRHLLPIAAALVVLVSLAAPAAAQDANGAGTRLAAGNASAKPGLKNEEIPEAKEDAVVTEGQTAGAEKSGCTDAQNKPVPCKPVVPAGK